MRCGRFSDKSEIFATWSLLLYVEILHRLTKLKEKSEMNAVHETKEKTESPVKTCAQTCCNFAISLKPGFSKIHEFFWVCSMGFPQWQHIMMNLLDASSMFPRSCSNVADCERRIWQVWPSLGVIWIDVSYKNTLKMVIRHKSKNLQKNTWNAYLSHTAGQRFVNICCCLKAVTGREINLFFPDSRLAPKFFRVVANSKNVRRHF